MNILTVTVTKESEIRVGEWYLITGKYQDGLQGLPQIYFVRQKHLHTKACGIPFLLGDLFFWQDGQKVALIKHAMPLADVNIPEHGFHDIHLERLNDLDPRVRLWKHQSQFNEAQKARNQLRVIPVSEKIYEPYLG